MKKRLPVPVALLALLLTLDSRLSTLFAQGTAFTYQGRLTVNGSPANGSYDLSFSLYSAAEPGGYLVTDSVTNLAVAVANGLFTTTIDFVGGGPLPGVFQGEDLWLEIGARTNGSAEPFVTLTTRQQITASPYAVYAGAAGFAMQVAAGSVQSGSLAPNAVTTPSIANGTVVRSLNGLSDTVNLNAGANVTITPSGNTLTIAASGGSGGSNSVWSVNGSSAYYNGGRVGIGTATPSSALEIAAQDAIKLSGNAPFLTFSDTSANTFSRIYGIGGGLSLIGSTYFSGNTAAYVQMDNGGNFRFGTNATVAGNLGIGTFTPQSALHISGVSDAVRLTGSNPFLTLEDTAAGLYSRIQAHGAGMDFKTQGAVDGNNPSGLLHLDGAGYVGIGTTTPSAKLQVVSADAGIDAVSGISTGGKGVYGTSSGSSGTSAGVWGDNTAAGGTALVGMAAGANSTGLYASGTGNAAYLAGNVIVTGNESFGNTIRQMVNLYDVTYGIGVQNNAQYFRTGGEFLWYRGGSHSPNIGDPASGTQLMRLGSTGTLIVSGSVQTPVLTITGGADVAEPFKMSSKEIPEGAVVVIDEDNPGKLKMSDRPYDQRVAGIVSGANGIKPGISLSQQGVLEGGQNVALSGRVYVLADASSSAIKPGDLLTTSSTPGHAMKANERGKAQGAILGKAMSALNDGKGMVLVLVSLQ